MIWWAAWSRPVERRARLYAPVEDVPIPKGANDRRHDCSVTAGTIFQDARTPLLTWFRAMVWVASQKTGASAGGLQQVLGFGSWATAWA